MTACVAWRLLRPPRRTRNDRCFGDCFVAESAPRNDRSKTAKAGISLEIPAFCRLWSVPAPTTPRLRRTSPLPIYSSSETFLLIVMPPKFGSRSRTTIRASVNDWLLVAKNS